MAESPPVPPSADFRPPGPPAAAPAPGGIGTPPGADFPAEELERVLGLLPLPVWRVAFDPVAVPLARQKLPAITFANLPARELPSVLSDGLVTTEALQRFEAAGRVLHDLEVTATDTAGTERRLKCRWLGVPAHGRLEALWIVAEDVTAELELRQRLAAPAAGGDEIIGRSPAIRAVLEKIAQVAPTDSTVLILGETGTGKELVARALHREGPRATKPLVSVNCGAIAAGLVESELFGHEKGAFTGALARRTGQFELADGGTLFLDEIGDLSPELQVKLLRVLQEGELTRVGGSQPVRVDVRVIAATHRDLAALVREGRFRQDLFYRLNIFPIRMPALRDRAEDIPLLASYFTQRFAARLGRRIESIPPAILDALQRHPWPGNIRELANIVERSVIVTHGRTLQLAEWVTGQFQPAVPLAQAPVAAVAPTSQTLEQLEREHIRRTLERTGWKVSGPGGAAEFLNLKPTTLEARMKKLGIARPR